MAFKKPIGDNNVKQEVEFAESAKNSTIDSAMKSELKMISVKLPIDLIERVKRYQKSDMARRIDTQSYIFENAITKWLDEKGFEK